MLLVYTREAGASVESFLEAHPLVFLFVLVLTPVVALSAHSVVRGTDPALAIQLGVLVGFVCGVLATLSGGRRPYCVAG